MELLPLFVFICGQLCFCWKNEYILWVIVGVKNLFNCPHNLNPINPISNLSHFSKKEQG